MRLFCEVKRLLFVFSIILSVGVFQSGAAWACATDAECPSPLVCSGGSCQMPCIVGPPCPAGQVTDCAGGCMPEPSGVPEMGEYLAVALLLMGAGFIFYQRRKIKVD